MVKVFILLVVSIAAASAQIVVNPTPGGTSSISCVATPGNTTGAYLSLCQTAAGALYACNNAAGCTVAGDWVAQGASFTFGSGLNLTAGNVTTDSSTQTFLKSGALTCGASTNGKMLVHTTPLQYCDNTATPALRYAAYGDSFGNATNLPANNRVRSFGASFDGAGVALTAGKTVYATVPYACTISGWNIVADTGTATVDIWQLGTGTAIPTVSNTITASAVPALATGTALHSTTMTSWATTHGGLAVAANDIFGFNLKVVASATYVNLVLECDQ